MRELAALLSLSPWSLVALPHDTCTMGLSAVCDCGMS